MATLDQLDPQQRAIIELVLKRGQSYEDLASTLDLTAGRVRELARAALAELAPTTAERVDAQWRGQLADYVLGQQTGPEAKATQGHLKSSEPARMWAVSLMDSLHGLYASGARPEIPGPEGDAGGRSSSPRSRSRPAGGGSGGRAVGGRKPARGPSGSAAGSAAASGAPGGTRALSPEARQAVRRRRLMVAAAALVLLLLVAGGIYGASGGESTSPPAPTPGGPAAAGAGQNAGEPRVLGQILMRPLEGEQGVGRATVAQQGNRRLLVVQAQDLAKLPKDELLEVWLYNSPRDAKSLGAQQVKAGKFQGLGDLPNDAGRYRFIDLSLEKADRNPAHSGKSVLRADLSQAQNQGQQQGGGGAPTPTP